ncbi:MAG: benzoate-CoA ligase family protein [Nitrososphaerota archaeon]
MGRLNLTEELVDRWVKAGNADKPCLFEVDKLAESFTAVTYRELCSITCRVADFLKDLGISWFNRVGILLPDSIAWVASFLGSIRIGAVPVVISPLNRPEVLAYIIKDSRPKALLTDHEAYERIRSEIRDFKYPKHVILVDESLSDHPPLNSIISSSIKSEDYVPPAETQADDFAFILYTSGSTSLPKGVIHLQHDLIEAADSLFKSALGLGSEDRFYSVSKLYFSFGMTNTLSALRLGASAIVDGERSTPERVLKIVSLLEPTAIFAAATLYARLLDKIDERNLEKIRKIRVMVSGGEHLPAKVWETWYRKFEKFIIAGIGSTEYLHKVTFNGPSSFKQGSLGKALPGHRVMVVDEEWNELPPNKVGRLAVECDACTPLYWHKADVSKKNIRGGWVMLDDLCYLDDEGFLHHVGRADEMIKQSGMWVSPFEIEDVLMSHPSVLEALVVKAEDEYGLERVKALVVLKRGIAPTDDLVRELKEYVKSRLEPYKRPEWIEFVDELPSTVTGKRKRIVLRRA